KTFPLFLCLILVFMLIIQPIFAGGESEGKKKNPLVLVSGNLSDGAKDVPVQTEIILNFSKNIAHMTVLDENAKCFSLVDAEGKPVQVDVVIADSQIEPEKRRDVHIRPLHDLEPGATYTVVVAPSFQSKSEVKLGEELKINFTTAGDKTPMDPSENKKENSSDVGADQKAIDTQQVSSNTVVNGPDLQGKDEGSNQSATNGDDIGEGTPIQDDVRDSDAVESAISTAGDNESESNTTEEQTTKASVGNKLLDKIPTIVLSFILIGLILYRIVKSRL
ncbi:MAG TPA: Ig-like domain-containing protein, partial [Clostridia bacterium]|nr:Ig-like domain-containing protein [Clostridia bacterium]